MATEQELIRYLKNHISYEWLMLRHTVSRLPNITHPLDWNALFESAFAHIRNLRSFLASSGDSREGLR